MKKIAVLFLILRLFDHCVASASEMSVSHEDTEPSWSQLTEVSYLWNHEFKPSITNSLDSTNIGVLISGAALTILTHQYDHDIREHNETDSNKIFSSEIANIGASLGSGTPGISIAILQLIFDRREGVAHAKSIAMTSLSHITIATIAQRDRPNKRNKLSFPSGHTSSSFATATALAYSYGYKVGIPAYLLATFVGVSRVNENIHWASDVVAGAALGIFWGRATSNFKKDSNYTIAPLITNDYAGINLNIKWD